MAALGRADAIVFTGGIGENSRLVRQLATQGMADLGIAVDPEKNERNEHDISSGRVKILVMPTNEELAIARDTRRILETTAGPEVRPAPEAAEKRPEVFRPDETARLVLLWARNPKADCSRLAKLFGQSLGRTVSAGATKKELERLSLTGTTAIPPRTSKTK
jgi:acetate kinase